MNKLAWSLLAALGVATAAYATTGTWTKSFAHYNIYTSGGYATMPFSQLAGVPLSGTSVTSVNYTWLPYSNGNTSEVVELCYSPPFSSTIGSCANISASQTGISNHLNGQSARGTFYIRHTITGGTYPAIGGTVSDTITVNYTY